jgi:hypothetical protein
MPDTSTLARFILDDMVVDYQLNKDSKAVSLRIFPAALEESIVPHLEKLEGRDIPAWYFEPLVQFRLQGDPTNEYTQGQTLRNSASLDSLLLEEQKVLE